MAVCGVAGDEYPAFLVLLGDRHAQVPEADVLELDRELEAAGTMQQAEKIVVLGGGFVGHRRMEEKALADIDATEKHPVALEIGMHDVVGGLDGKAFHALVQFPGTEHHQHHLLVELGAGAGDTHLLANHGMTAVATHDVVGLEYPPGSAVALGDGDARRLFILDDALRTPAEQRVHAGQRGQALPQHRFGAVLRQPVVFLKIIFLHQFALRRGGPEFAHQVSVGADAAGGHARGHDAGGAQFLHAVPEVEMLQGALREILAFGNALRLAVALHQRAGDAALSQFDCKTDAHRTAAHDHDLILFLHDIPARI